MAEGQGLLGSGQEKRALGGQESFLQEADGQAAWFMQRIWMGRDMRGWRVWSCFPKGQVWNWGNTIHIPGGKKLVWSNQGG